ncbi:TPA: sigma-54-dependent Fis family transcriptional regulator [Candidatus Poribacteria bacterium]|nr:sigma-54-dependent Fis family transcriptional regulator [Candidatus Poribacteria bacterium]
MTAKQKIKILFVDDELERWETLIASKLSSKGMLVLGESKGTKTLSWLERDPSIDIVLLDLTFENQPKDGKDILEEIKRRFPNMPVIIFTGDDRISSAVECVKRGAFDYFTKVPLDFEKLAIAIKNAVEDAKKSRINEYLRAELEEKTQFDVIVGKSPAIQAIFEQIRNVARTDTTVLIMGESGTGKELAAKAIHANSNRREKPLVVVNCCAIPRELMESELFGHERGAFTNAIRQRKGKFELANGGTIFLDEVGDLEMSLQVKLLRVLQERCFERVGGNETIQVDVRIIAATNRNLFQSVKEHEFREDLYYRLNVFPIMMPPLRTHKEDIPLLVEHCIRKFNAKLNRKVEEIDEEALQLLTEYDWPGNVRELENVIERAFVLSWESGRVLNPFHFPALRAIPQKKLSITETALIQDFYSQICAGKKTLNDVPREYQPEIIKIVLEKEKGYARSAAKVLGVTYGAFRRKLSDWDISSLDFRNSK